MTVKELINRLQKLENQDAEIVLEDSALGLAVKLSSINEKSNWEKGSIDLCGSKVPDGEDPWFDDEDEEEE